MRIRCRLLLSACLAGALAACTPVISNHGYAPVAEELERIQIGKDTRGSVRRKIGRPSGAGIFTDEGWYYVATRIERLTFNEPRVLDRRVVAIKFDERNVVAAVNEYGVEDGRIVDLESRTTPTYGRELTILEQALGNLGVITGTDIFGDSN